MRNARKSLLAALVAAALLVSACAGVLTVPEYPSLRRAGGDAILYLSDSLGDDVALETIRILERNYDRNAALTQYACAVQYRLSQETQVYTDDLTLQYALEGGRWTLKACQSDSFAARRPALLHSIAIRPEDREPHRLFFEAVQPFFRRTAALSDRLFDFTVALDDTVYALPCSFAALAADGWTLSETDAYGATDTMEPQTYGMLEMQRGDAHIVAYVTNFSGDPIPIGSSQIGGVRAYANEVAFALGPVTQTSTPEEVIAAFGAPDADETTNEGRLLRYAVDDMTYAAFLFSETTARLELWNFKDYTPPAAAASPLFARYRYALALGAAAEETAVYTLPCDVAAFLAAGWRLQGTASEDVIPWYAPPAAYTLVRGDESLRITVINPTGNDRALSLCSVAALSLSPQSGAFALPLALSAEEAPQSLASGASYEAILRLFGEPDAREALAGGERLTYAQDASRSVSLTVLHGALNAATLTAGGKEAFHVFDYYRFQLTLEEDGYTLPCAWAAFAQNGWALQSEPGETLAAGAYRQYAITTQRGKSAVVYLCNPTGAALPLEACTVGGVIAGAGCTLHVSGGVGTQSERAVLLSGFGLPDAQLETQDGMLYLYQLDANRFAAFTLSADQTHVTGVRVVNFAL